MSTLSEMPLRKWNLIDIEGVGDQGLEAVTTHPVI
jgi:hypothetical protein